MASVEVLLCQYPDIPEILRKLNLELRDICEEKKGLYSTVKAAKLTDMPRRRNIFNPVLTNVEKLIDIYARQVNSIKEEIDYYTQIRETVNKGLQKLTSRERKLVDFRYFKGYSWDNTAIALGYSRRHCHRLDIILKNKLEKIMSQKV